MLRRTHSISPVLHGPQQLSGQVLMTIAHALRCQHKRALAYLSSALCHMRSFGHLAPTWLFFAALTPVVVQI